jgi:protein involved in polysaccharide export with SLBB domain
MSNYSFRGWIVGLALSIWSATPLFAADVQPASPPLPSATSNAPASLSVGPGAKRAAWQQRLTLGAGDTVNLALFDHPESAQTEVPVGPDGRISFLQARDVTAAGLTIDELRAKLDETLGNFYQNPRTVVIPAVIRSKRYVVLGAVTGRGVYALERPMTVIEAIARAGGLETGLYGTRTVEMADLQHSFLVRNGQRLPIDFERLFQRGDLSQNVAIEPDDYLYFASAGVNEIYVLGEVQNPGALVFAPNPTVLNAIAARGGFTEKAYRHRVLVVRGSLNHPQTFVVESAAILSGKAKDFQLQPRDIVFVSHSAWVTAEDVLDTAARAFIQGAIVTLTTRNVGPLLPLIK